MKHSKLLAGIILGSVIGSPVLAQDSGVIGPSPYDFNTDTWLQPWAEAGQTFGGTSGVHVESQDRIFVLQRGETELPSPIPPEYTNFAGSMGWNVLRGRGRVWENCIYVIDSDGNVLEVWDQWDHLFVGTDGPGPHRIRQNPYDEEKRVWVIDETGKMNIILTSLKM